METTPKTSKEVTPEDAKAIGGGDLTTPPDTLPAPTDNPVLRVLEDWFGNVDP